MRGWGGGKRNEMKTNMLVPIHLKRLFFEGRRLLRWTPCQLKYIAPRDNLASVFIKDIKFIKFIKDIKPFFELYEIHVEIYNFYKVHKRGLYLL